jgi:molybdate transport system regulatory protein
VLCIKVWLEMDGKYAFGLGLSEILQAVDRPGSIKHAAHDLCKSYRYVWNRIKQAETALGQTLVQTQVGGTGTQRSMLTEAAQRLVTGFLTFHSQMLQLVEEEFARHVLFDSAQHMSDSHSEECLP